MLATERFEVAARAAVVALLLPSTPALSQEAAREDPAPAPAGQVDVEAQTPDELIEGRLREIFSSLDGLRGVGVAVTSGVVTLTGTVPSAAASGDAAELAGRTEGVVLVRNRLEEPAEVAARLAPAVDRLKELYQTAVRKLPLIGIALLVVLVAVLVGNLLYRWDALYRRLRLSTLGRSLARRLARLATVLVGLLVALEVLDATAVVGAVLGVAGLAGIAIGFAFRNIAENYLAGVLLSTRNPFEIGDTVEIGGRQGKVARLTSRDTVLVTPDGNHLRIPNAAVVNSELTNFTRNPLRRFEFTVGVAVELDLSMARALAVETLRGAPGVLAEPAPQALIDELGDSAVVLKLTGWIDQRESDFLKTRSEAIRLLKAAFDAAGIEMPEPIYRVHLRNLPDCSTGPSSAGAGAGDRSQNPRPQREGLPSQNPPRGPVPGARGAPEVDVSPDEAIDEEVERERRAADGPNLLDDEAANGGRR